MTTNLRRNTSFVSLLLTPNDSEPEESDHEPVSVTSDLCINYCVNFAPNQLDLPPESDSDSGEVSNSDKYEHLNVEHIMGGITNTLYKVTNSKNNKSVLLRFFGPSSYKIIDRKRERYITDLLSRFQISKTIYSYFKDGQVEEWIEGRNMVEEDLFDSNYMVQIAQNLKKLHSIAVHGEMSRLINDGNDVPKSSLWPTIWKYYKLSLKYFRKYNKPILKTDLYSLRHKMKIIEEVCGRAKSPLVLCHADLLAGNIILMPNDHVRFIDFEYSCCMERGFDIANHFNEYMGFDLKEDRFPTLEMQREFLREYLKYDIAEWRPSLEGFLGRVQVTRNEEAVNDLLIEIQPFFMASHIFWGVWAVLQSMFSTIEFRYAEYADNRFNMFLNDRFWDTYEKN